MVGGLGPTRRRLPGERPDEAGVRVGERDLVQQPAQLELPLRTEKRSAPQTSPRHNFPHVARPPPPETRVHRGTVAGAHAFRRRRRSPPPRPCGAGSSARSRLLFSAWRWRRRRFRPAAPLARKKAPGDYFAVK
ncbi:hypothetical protein Anae109_3291 [Anaeromyxobacter sp. Fw109-5]|nr:hypothetical protein Anae109_3291 [Anaeromyxobacter sp. Fw109-5]